MPLKPGDRAPDFEAQDQDGNTVRSDDLRGRRYVLYFYPHNDTAVCTREACAFEDARPELESVGVPVFGVSPNSARSHGRFATKHGLGFRLLADPERKIVAAYDVAGFLGRTSRVTYIIGPDGKIEDMRRAELSGKGHATWARQRIRELQNQAVA